MLLQTPFDAAPGQSVQFSEGPVRDNTILCKYSPRLPCPALAQAFSSLGLFLLPEDGRAALEPAPPACQKFDRDDRLFDLSSFSTELSEHFLNVHAGNSASAELSRR